MLLVYNESRFIEHPVVSVFCNAYNQEAYISKCLDGFLMQETSFPFEVLITDDASTDRTPEIIKSYAERRPDLFLAILHDENQYSKDVNHNRDYLFPRARGSYIAFCEGDDYWTDSHKLQRQYDAMERHPSATWCIHAAVNVEADTEKPLFVTKPFDHDCILEFKDTGDQVQLAATASFFVRREAYSAYLDSAPSKVPCHGDFKMSRFFALTGDTVYLADIMSAYRVFSKSSINNGIAHSKDWRNVITRNTDNRIAYLQALDQWSEGAHSQEIADEIDRMEYLGAIDLKDYKTLEARWPVKFSTESFATRAKVKFLGAHPVLHDSLRTFKSRHMPYFGLKG